MLVSVLHRQHYFFFRQPNFDTAIKDHFTEKTWAVLSMFAVYAPTSALIFITNYRNENICADTSYFFPSYLFEYFERLHSFL